MVQMARALINDPSFINKLREGDFTTRAGCDHRDYCIARMYSDKMMCCHNCTEHIPERLWKELRKIK
jgi:2,4-dienoyl-CoA reductase-like NADH-dependent reductase (Old Yellow Enzyme family)